MKPVPLSIVIVSWNTRDLLAQCLDSLEAAAKPIAGPEPTGELDQAPLTAAGASSQAVDQRAPGIEVFVVDNASSDGSADLVRERFPWVELIENPTNVGFAQANNQAIRASRGRLVLLLNPDTVLEPGALVALLAFMEAKPGAGAAGARLLNPDGSLQPSCTPAPTVSRELWRLFHLDALHPYGSYDMSPWPVDRPREVDTVQGAALIVRREAFAQAGLLDEDYFIYSEEVDLCQRIREAGWQVFWVPQSRVIHYGGQSTRQVAPAMFLELYANKVLYFRKRQGIWAARTYKLVLGAAALARLVVGPLALLESPEPRGQHLRLVGNYWRLLQVLPSL